MVWHSALDRHAESVLVSFVDLLTGPAARKALAGRDIAAVYRMLRDAGVSQASIAQATGQKQSEVSEIISGRQVQSVVLLERIADGLGVPRGWMGLAHELDRVPTVHDKPQSEDLSDANLLRHAVTVLHSKPLFGLAHPICVRNTPTPVPRRVGPADIAQVAATTERLGQLARDLGGISMTSALTAHARASDALLGTAMPEPVRKELLVMPNEALKLFQLGAAGASGALARFRLEYDCAYALALLGAAREAIAALRRAEESYHAARDEPPPWKNFAAANSHVEGCTYFALGRFDRAARVLSAATDGMRHAVVCAVDNSARLSAAQLRSGELGAGLRTAQQVMRLAKGLRLVSLRDSLAPLQEAAAARRDSACQDLAREVALLRSAA